MDQKRKLKLAPLIQLPLTGPNLNSIALVG
jgi:hypothetical protein